MVSPSTHESISGRNACPLEGSRTTTPGITIDEVRRIAAANNAQSALYSATHQLSPPPQELTNDARTAVEAHTKHASAEIEAPSRDIPTPMTATDDGVGEQRVSQASPTSSTAPVPAPVSVFANHLSLPFPTRRFLPNSSSSLLRPGSRFKGSQTSDRQQYEVEVEIKHIDMRESFMCGYLRIKGLTHDHPSLTTYFESEIIGNKYSFITQHPEWGSDEKVDRQHWARFQAYKPIQKYPSRLEAATKDWMQKEHLFMRWKEYFLVPDHRVRTIDGASFEGFYYICFNQSSGVIEGIYFHAKSERFQKLQLEHIKDYGCQGAVEFR